MSCLAKANSHRLVSQVGVADVAKRSSAFAILLFWGIAVPLVGYCDATSSGLLKTVFGDRMTDVAEKVATLHEKYHDVYAWALDFSPDGKHLVSGSDNQNINIWDWRNGRIENTIIKPPGSNNGVMSSPLIAFSPDGRLLAVCLGKGEGDAVIRVWNTESWSIAIDVVEHAPGACRAMTFTPDGQSLMYLIYSLYRDEMIVYSVGTWDLAWSLQFDLGPEKSVAADPTGTLLAVAGILMIRPPHFTGFEPVEYHPNIAIVNLRERKIVNTLKGDAMGPMAWSPDGKRLAIEGREYVEIFDVTSSQTLIHERVENSGSRNVRFSPDGRYFIESDWNGQGRGLGVKIWDSARRNLLQSIPGDISSLAISKDGQFLAVGSTGWTQVWQLK